MTATRPWLTCAWFVRCTREATVTVHHPVLGSVPTCTHCVEHLGLTPEKAL